MAGLRSNPPVPSSWRMGISSRSDDVNEMFTTKRMECFEFMAPCKEWKVHLIPGQVEEMHVAEALRPDSRDHTLPIALEALYCSEPHSLGCSL